MYSEGSERFCPHPESREGRLWLPSHRPRRDLGDLRAAGPRAALLPEPDVNACARLFACVLPARGSPDFALTLPSPVSCRREDTGVGTAVMLLRIDCRGGPIDLARAVGGGDMRPLGEGSGSSPSPLVVRTRLAALGPASEAVKTSSTGMVWIEVVGRRLGPSSTDSVSPLES
jgi:hypothetical protein